MVNSPTRFWLIRHALVAESARAILYGTIDVPLCPDRLVEEVALLARLAAYLPRPAHWVCTPLSRTRHTAEAIFAAGYPGQKLAVEPGFSEQELGEWQGIAHHELPEKLADPAHPFWPLAGHERPPGGESIDDVSARVGPVLERLADAHAGGDVVVVSHGGAICGMIAHAARLSGNQALHFAIANLSLSQLERAPEGWHILSVNQLL